MSNDPLLTVEEVADRLSVSVATVRRRAATGQLQAQKVGRQWLILAASLPAGSPRGRRPPPSAQVDFAAAIRHIGHRDLNELWVPDPLRCADLLRSPSDLIAEASRRLAAQGPFDPISEVEVPKTAFFSRPAAMLTMEDRLAYHGAVASFAGRVESMLTPGVFSARAAQNPDYLLLKGSKQWVKWMESVAAAVMRGYEWMVPRGRNSRFMVRHDMRYAFAAAQMLRR